MKKLTTLLVLAAMLTALLASCASDADSGTPAQTTASDVAAETTAAVTEEDIASDDLPSDLNYDGYEFKVHSRYAPSYFGYTVSVAEETGDVVNDAIYARDRALEERLNIVFTETTYDNATEGQEVPKTLIMAGDDTYDLFVARNLQSFTWAMEGLVVDWNQLGYVDLDKPYWDSTINESFYLNDALYFAAGAFNLTTYEWTHTLLFNKKMHESLDLDDPYAIVKDGTWTYDRFIEMAKPAIMDVNGDSVMDINDRYGYICYDAQVLPCFWIAADTLSIKRDADGVFYYSTPEDEKFLSVYSKVLETMWGDNLWYRMPKTPNTLEDQIRPFAEEGGLFGNANFYRISKLRAMETDFGILPYPKWDESQEEYISRIEGCEMPLVPPTNSDLDRTGAVLEALASESYKTVVPAYYDQAVTGKYARDEESIEMLSIITANRIFDYGDTVLCSQIRDGILRTAFSTNNADIVSALEGHRPTVQARLNEINTVE